MDSSDDQARSHEHLRLPIARAVLEMSIVHFDFRPELSKKVILKSVVPRVRAADRHLVARWQRHAKGALDVERSEALPVCDGRRDDCVGRSILVLTCGKCRLKKRRQNVFSNRSEEHTSELQSLTNLVCRLLLEKKKNKKNT